MKLSEIRRLFAYNAWGNDRILTVAEGLSAEVFITRTSFPYGSLRNTLVHILFAEWAWRNRLSGNSPKAGDLLIEAEDYPDTDSLRAAWKPEQAALDAYIASLDSDLLKETCSYQNLKGIEHRQEVGDILLHLVLHGMQHRAEAAQMLTEFGLSPGDIDYIIWLRKQ